VRLAHFPVALVVGMLLGEAALSAPPAAQISVDLETALQWTLTSNPDLVAMRRDLGVSAAAIAVARRFPMSLNPTVSMDVRPWTFEHDSGAGSQRLGTQVSVSWMQPLEFGHRTGYRTAIARADYSQAQWNIQQAELLTLVESYRLHQTALYRGEKLHVARQLAGFNAQLVQTVRRQMEAGQVSASELVLAEVENQSMRQILQTAEQEYADAVAAMRRQIGIPDYAASMVPVGPLRVPEGLAGGDEQAWMQVALDSHPEINAAKARVAASHASVCLARAERIPIPAVGPVYENDESGTSFYGIGLSTPVPALNTGRTLVHQQEMVHRRDLVALEQTRVRTITRLRADMAKWGQIRSLVEPIEASTREIQAQVEKMERLYAAGQSDLLKLLSVRQRLIEAESARLDMVWQTTQAYADLLAATGGVPLLGELTPSSELPTK